MEVREIVYGISSSSEILEIHQWITDMYKIGQQTFWTRVISMDMEDVKTTYYDTLRMAGKLEISSRRPVLRTQLEPEIIYRFGKDGWRQIPGKIMKGDRVPWVCIIYYILRLEQE